MGKIVNYKFLFIVNPKAGKGKFKKLIPYIKNEFPKKIQYDIVISQFPGEAREMIRKRFDEYDIFVAAGGDGTVNEVASELIYTDKHLGIIPIGSGNGLAREMGIPLSFRRAVKRLEKVHSIKIDTILINSTPFINMAGVGFDALMARRFEGEGKRGIGPYIKLAPKTLIKYKPQEYEIQIDSQLFKKTAYMVSIANTSQFGGGAHICPPARPDDGIMNLVILKPFKYARIPELTYRLFTKNIHKSKSLEIYQCKKIRIKGENLLTHTDGEPVELGDELDISIRPNSLSVIC